MILKFSEEIYIYRSTQQTQETFGNLNFKCKSKRTAVMWF